MYLIFSVHSKILTKTVEEILTNQTTEFSFHYFRELPPGDFSFWRAGDVMSTFVSYSIVFWNRKIKN
jgi:hypothetical protein